MPFVNISYVKENIADGDEAKRTRIADAISKVLAEEMNLSQGDVWVAFDAVPARDFYVGQNSVEALRKKK